MASYWFPDGKRILGECTPISAGLCALDPATGTVTKSSSTILKVSSCFPAFRGMEMGDVHAAPSPQHRGMRDAGSAGRLVSRGSRVGEDLATGRFSTRPRFAPDGNSIFYLWNEKGVLTLMCQELYPATRHPRGPAARLAPVQVFPSTLAYSIGASNTVVGVSGARVFYNAIDVRSNVWMTSIE